MGSEYTQAKMNLYEMKILMKINQAMATIILSLK